MSTQGWKLVRPHVVMIKFRKGGSDKIAGSMAPPAGSGLSIPKSKSGATGPNVTLLPTVEDFQLPLRFRRRPIGDKEMEYINRGGPE